MILLRYLTGFRVICGKAKQIYRDNTYGIGAGDAVFVPDFTYIATAGCASILGATPVFVDIDPQTFNIDADALERAVAQTLKETELTPLCSALRRHNPQAVPPVRLPAFPE